MLVSPIYLGLAGVQRRYELRSRGQQMESQPKIGRITIAPDVLETVARLTTLAVPGVARLTAPTGPGRFVRKDGVRINLQGGTVTIDLYVVAEPEASMLSVGRHIQAEVTRAIQDIVGMDVQAVNVHIEDVAYPLEKA